MSGLVGISFEELEQLSYREIQGHAKKAGLKANAGRDILIANIVKYFVE
jgi:hypothetical protein